jgi:hypothetical protein
MSPVADSVIRRLDAARQKWWLFTLLSTSVLAMSASLGLFIAFMLGDALLRFSQWTLLGLLVVWVGVTVALVVVVGRRLVRSQRSLEATARRVEAEFPELGSNLINIVQLSTDGKQQHSGFAEAAVQEAASHVGRTPFEEAPAKESRRRRLVHCMQTPRDLAEATGLLVTLVIVAVLCRILIPGWGSAAARLMNPLQFVPVVGSVEIVKVTPGDVEVLVGSSLEIAAEIRNPEGKPHKAELFVTIEGEKETAAPMAGDAEQRRYTLTLPSVLKPLKYRLEIGDSQTAIYTVGVREKPAIAEVEVTLRYPPYLGRSDETFLQPHADLQAPQFTIANLRVRPTAPVAAGYLEMQGQKISGRVEQGGAWLAIENIPLVEDGTFTIHLANTAGHTDPTPRVNRVRVVHDRPPVVELLKPPRQLSSAPGSEIDVMIRASDDLGLGRVYLEMKVKDDPVEVERAALDSVFEAAAESAAAGAEPAVRVRQWTDFQGGAAAVRSHKLALRPEEFKPGQRVLLRAVAVDRRMINLFGRDLRPQESATGWHVVELVAPEDRATAAVEQIEGLRTAVWQILEKQIRARVRTAQIPRAEALAERSAMAGEVRAAQVDVQKMASDLAASIAGGDELQVAAKRVLSALAFNEMLDAVRRCDALVRLDVLEAFNEPLPELVATQDRIIEVLRKLLDVARRNQDEVLAEMPKRSAGDLPQDVLDQLQDARDKLAEFLEHQKRVIEASENLAKMPVEDFTEKEEELLKQLAASQDDWSKFMEELVTDLSKLPEQDFANASLLQELVEIQTELKMAEDALLKKTADIAVPLEQLGAERAEEIVTNLEKWLPDTPDRERWSQEESLTDADKEAPMAELPGELEDLIGELLEEEEDLFDEMEDVSSSAADSLDKGAGWDVADGPISNMSAKGATGNRLPNTSEIGGRAGEGRSGKSSGEFVGDEAVGKGGRNTPSRLTPDPFVQGQIKDHSKDGTGGATGGGKESGQGGEGLEGPQRTPPGERDLQRLAGKQAALRNKAEGIDLQFQIMNFHRTDLQRMIDLMEQVERDLRAGRYQNALRQRQVLADGLGNVKQYLSGEFEIRQDQTVNLPSDIQKELLGSMQDPSPVGWEELNRQYFERLSETGGN